MTDFTYNIIINSDKEIPDNAQDIIDDITTLFLQKVVEQGFINSEEEAIKLFHDIYNYAEGKGYDLDIVSQVLKQVLEQTEDQEEQ